MRKIKQLLLVLLSAAFASLPLLNAQTVGANSYFGGNGRLVFYSPVSESDPAQEIYTVKPDGSDLKRITNNSNQDSNPQWAPSGDKIAYDHYVDGTNQRDIYIQNINPDGSANGSPTVLATANTTDNEWDPSWSPDGTKIAYHRRSTPGSGPNHILVTNSNGSGSPVVVTNNQNYRDTEPTWNKDGNQLAFTHTLVADETASIAVASPTASATVNVVDTGVVGSPQWSPIGNKVTYAKAGELWIYDKAADDADGTGSSDNLTQLTSGASIVNAPTWSPDGTLILASNNGTMQFYNASTGQAVQSHTIASNSGLGFTSSNNANEIDWARAEPPENTVHECTTYVNQDCTEFTPSIPAECQNVTSVASHGTPQYENGAFIFTPEEDYVGDDGYVYTYYDGNMNAITCTITIHVLPLAPDTGTTKNQHVSLYVGIAVGTIGLGALVRRRFTKIRH
jgi:Tol biopolymer transport system component